MAESKPLRDFITLGQRLRVLVHPEPYHVDWVIEEIKGVVELLDVCGLRRSRVAAQALDDI